jgi:cobalt/nickel transport system permease protein
MADALLSPAVGIAMDVVSVGSIAYAVTRITKNELSEKKIPLMGIAGALVFAGQMINFTIPGTGSSGHIGGGILLAGLIGAFPALLSISAVLIIQCLFFADGGLLALGANIFNMGVIPCLLVYPLIFRPIVKKRMSYKTITIAGIVSVVLGLQLGAFGVVLETLFSGITQLPFGTFVLLMQPIHLAIGLVEGIVTAGILCFVYRSRPEILEGAMERRSIAGVSVKRVVTVLVILVVVVGGAVSLFASSHPDGLEWAIDKVAGTTELTSDGEIYDKAAQIQDAVAFLPDYGFAGAEDSPAGTSVSGIVGAGIAFALAAGTGFIIFAVKKKKADAKA